MEKEQPKKTEIVLTERDIEMKKLMLEEMNLQKDALELSIPVVEKEISLNLSVRRSQMALKQQKSQLEQIKKNIEIIEKQLKDGKQVVIQ